MKVIVIDDSRNSTFQYKSNRSFKQKEIDLASITYRGYICTL